jgi:hypothetical protein
MRLTSSLLALAALSLLVPGVADAGRWNGGGCGGWGAKSPYDQHFDSETMIRVWGEVCRVETFRPRPGMTPGIQFQLFTGEADLPADDATLLRVHLGPEWFLEDLDIRLEEGMGVGVRGSLVLWGDETILMAAELVDDAEEVLTLRAENGYPAWSPGP